MGETNRKVVFLSPQHDFSRQYNYQSWKRLHWCRSKVQSALQVTSLMAMFSLVSIIKHNIHEEGAMKFKLVKDTHFLKIALVELPLPLEEKYTHPNLVIGFVATSSTLIAITVVVKVISAFILPHLDSTVEMSETESLNSPHDQIINWIFWTCILGHTVAPTLFCLDLILISWIKFPKYAKDAPLAVTAILVPMIVVILLFGGILCRQMNQFQVKNSSLHGFPNRRYSEIAEDWEMGSTSLSSSSFVDEESQLIKSHNSVTSYGAVAQHEFIGSPSSVFADVFFH